MPVSVPGCKRDTVPPWISDSGDTHTKLEVNKRMNAVTVLWEQQKDVMIEGVCFRQRGQGKLEALTFKLGLSAGKKTGRQVREKKTLGWEKNLAGLGNGVRTVGLSLVRGGEMQSERWAR